MKKKRKKALRPLLALMLVLSILTGNFVGVQLDFLTSTVYAADFSIYKRAGIITQDMLTALKNAVSVSSYDTYYTYDGKSFLTIKGLSDYEMSAYVGKPYYRENTAINSASKQKALDQLNTIPNNNSYTITVYSILPKSLENEYYTSAGSNSAFNVYTDFYRQWMEYDSSLGCNIMRSVYVTSTLKSYTLPQQYVDDYLNDLNYYTGPKGKFTFSSVGGSSGGYKNALYVTGVSTPYNVDCCYTCGFDCNEAIRDITVPADSIYCKILNLTKLKEDTIQAINDNNYNLLSKLNPLWQSFAYTIYQAGHGGYTIYNNTISYRDLLTYLNGCGSTNELSSFEEQIQCIQTISDANLIREKIYNSNALSLATVIELDRMIDEQLITSTRNIIPNIQAQNITTAVYGTPMNIAIKILNSDTSKEFTVVKPDGATVKVTAPTTVYFPVTKNGTYTFYTTSPTGQMVTTPITVSSYRDTPQVKISPITTSYSDSGVDYLISATCADKIQSVSVVAPNGAESVVGESSGRYTATANGTYYVKVVTEYQTYTAVNAGWYFNVSLVFPSTDNGYNVAQMQSLNSVAYPISPSANGTKYGSATIGFAIAPSNHSYTVFCETLNRSIPNNGSSQYLVNVDKNQTYNFTITDPTGKVLNRSITVSDIQNSPTLTLSSKVNRDNDEVTIYVTSTGTTATSKTRVTNSLTNPNGGTVIGTNSATYAINENGTYYFSVVNEDGTYYSSSIDVTEIVHKIIPTFELSYEQEDGSPVTSDTFLEYNDENEPEITYIKGTITSGGEPSNYTVYGPYNDPIIVQSDLTFRYPITANSMYSFTVQTDPTLTCQKNYTVNSYRCVPVISVIPSTTAITDKPITLTINALCQDTLNSIAVTNPSGETRTIGQSSGSYNATENGTYTITAKTILPTHNVFTRTFEVSNIIDEVQVDCVTEDVTEEVNVYLNSESEMESQSKEQVTQERVSSVKVKFEVFPLKDSQNNDLLYKVKATHLSGEQTFTVGEFEDIITANGEYTYNILSPTGTTITKTVKITSIQTMPTLDLNYEITEDGKALIYVNSSSEDEIQKVTNSTGHSIGNMEELTSTVDSNGCYEFTVFTKSGLRATRFIVVDDIPDNPTIEISATEIGDPCNTVKLYPIIDTIYGVKSVTLPNGEVSTYEGQTAGHYELTDATFTTTCNGEYTFIIEDNKGSIFTVNYEVSAISNTPIIKARLDVETWVNEVPITLNVNVKDCSSQGLKMVRISRVYEGESNSKIIRTYSPGTAPSVYDEDISVDRNAVYTIEVWDNSMSIDDDPFVYRKRVVNIDTVNPTLEATTDCDSNNWYREVKYHFVADDNSSVKNIICDNGSVINAYEGDIIFNANGTYHVKSYDWAGNNSSEETIIIDNIDNGEPTINVVQDSYGNLTTPVTFKLTFMNRKSPLNIITFPDGTTQDISSQRKNVYKTTYTAPDNGLYVFKASNMTHYEAIASAYLTTVDRTNPTLVVTPSTESWTAGNVVLSIEAQDAEGETSITLPDGTVLENTSLATYTVTANGTYAISTSDRAGNVVSKSITVTCIDREQPIAPEVEKQENTFIVKASLPPSGLKTVEVDVEDLTTDAGPVRKTLPLPSIKYPTDSENSATLSFSSEDLRLDVSHKYKLIFYITNGLDVLSKSYTTSLVYIPSTQAAKDFINDSLGDNPTTDDYVHTLKDLLAIIDSLDKSDSKYEELMEMYKKYVNDYYSKLYEETLSKDRELSKAEAEKYYNDLQDFINSISKNKEELGSEFTNLEALKELLQSYKSLVDKESSKTTEQILKDLNFIKYLEEKGINFDLSNLKDYYSNIIKNSVTDDINEALDEFRKSLITNGDDAPAKMQESITTIQTLLEKYKDILPQDILDSLKSHIDVFIKGINDYLITEGQAVKDSNYENSVLNTLIEKLLNLQATGKLDNKVLENIMSNLKEYFNTIDWSNITSEELSKLMNTLSQHMKLKDLLSEEDISYITKLQENLQKRAEEILKEKLDKEIQDILKPSDSGDISDKTIEDIIKDIFNGDDGSLDSKSKLDVILDALNDYLAELGKQDKPSVDSYEDLKKLIEDLLNNPNTTDEQKTILQDLLDQIKPIIDRLKDKNNSESNNSNTNTGAGGGASGSGGAGGSGGSTSDSSDTDTNSSSGVSTKLLKVKVTIEQSFYNAVKTYQIGYGKDFTTTITLPENYEIESVLVNNKSYVIKDNTIAIKSVTSFQDIYVSVIPKEKAIDSYYKISPTVLGNGELNYSAPFTVVKGDTVNIEAKPETGFKVRGIYVNNVFMSTDQTKYTFKNVSKDISIEVLFERNGGVSTGLIKNNHTFVYHLNSKAVTFDKQTYDLTAPVTKAKDIPYIPLNSILRYLNVPNENIYWNSAEKVFILYCDNNMYKFGVCNSIVVNGVESKLQHPVGLMQDRLMIPISAIPVIFKTCNPKVVWDTDTNDITITITDYGYTNPIESYDYFF